MKIDDEKMDNGKKWITINDDRLAELIIKSIGDEDKKNIINAAINEPMTIYEMIEKSKVPSTTGYRKANVLIHDMILIPDGYAKTWYGKQVTKYKAWFESINISIKKNKVAVTILVAQNFKKEHENFKVLNDVLLLHVNKN